MNRFKNTAACVLLLSASAMAQSADLEFIKTVDPQLYEKLIAIEKCRKQNQSAEACRAQLNKDTTVAKAPSAKPAAPAAKNTKPQNWWLHSSYYPNQPVSQWYHAFEGTASLNQLSGNIDGSQNTFSASYFARYSAWTNRLFLAYSKDNVKQSDVLVSDRDYRLFNYSGRYDFDSTWFGQMGYIHEQDSVLSIDDKTVGYLGLGAHLSDSAQYKLHLLGAYGHQTDDILDVAQPLTGLDEFDYEVAYLNQEFNWVIGKNLKLVQSASVLYSLDKLADFTLTTNGGCIDLLSPTASYCVKSYDHSTQVKLTLGLEYGLSQWISLMYSFEYDYNSQPFLEDKSRNTSQILGIKARFQ